ncbi:NAD(P)H-binding protein [Moraxella catarrhalis]|uniref:Oxidoreductase n=1 Tax=Moraxella catarrhalis TaxID=480 RepID=A0A198UIN8_MORCA|nr:NAD(P)H-binding protein [Moraxella catarrhalis]OAU96318.1 Oxidoreductase [Moraxella catarrhalis]OAU97232.1 Oxidoreductase [Moraxella catarrhalis]OAV03535.1 Oxidoreductase [Moraxella catarrhalis]
MKALVIGATGATGRALTEQLLTDPDYDSVHVFVRKDMDICHDKLTVHLIDFDQPETWAEAVKGDVLYSCLGTTLKQAGSKDRQWRVDYEYQLAFAKAAAINGVPYYVLISAENADANSWLFYPRLKGTLERAVSNLSFERCVIVRPPLLKHPNTDRVAEKIGETVLGTISQIKPFGSLKPMPVADLASAMRQAIKQGKSGIIAKEMLWQLSALDHQNG